MRDLRHHLLFGAMLSLITSASLAGATVGGSIYNSAGTATQTPASCTIHIYNTDTGLPLVSQAGFSSDFFNIAVTAPADGTQCIVYLETGTAGDRCATFFRWNGAGNQTGINLRKTYVRYNQNGHGTGFTEDTGSIPAFVSTNLVQSDPGDFVDAYSFTTGIGLQLVNSTTLTLTYNFCYEWFNAVVVDSGCTFTESATIIQYYAGDLTVNGTYSFSGWSIQEFWDGSATISGSGTITVGDFYVDPGVTVSVAAGTTVLDTWTTSINGTLNLAGTWRVIANNKTVYLGAATSVVNVAAGATLAAGDVARDNEMSSILVWGGTLTVNGGDVYSNDYFQVANGATLTLNSGSVHCSYYDGAGAGSSSVTAKFGMAAGSTFNANGGTVYVYGSYDTTTTHPAVQLAGTVNTGLTAFELINSTGTNESYYVDFQNKSIGGLTINKSGNSVTLMSALNVAGNVTNTAGTFLTAGFGVTLTGNWSNSGTYTHGNSAIVFNGASSITGASSFYRVTVNAAKSLTCAAVVATTVTNTLTINGTLTVSGGTVNVTNIGVDCSLNVGAGGVLAVSSGTMNAGFRCTASISGAVTVSGGLFTRPAALPRVMTINNGGSISVSAGSFTYLPNLDNGVTVASGGTFTASGGTVTIGTLASSQLTDLLVGGTVTLSGATVDVADEIEVSATGTLTISGGTVTACAYTGAGEGSSASKFSVLAGGTFNSNGGTLVINGVNNTAYALDVFGVSVAGTCSGDDTALVLSSNQTTVEDYHMDWGSASFASVTVNTPAKICYFDGVTAVTSAGDFTITAGTARGSVNTFYIGGNWTNDGTFTHGNSTVVFNGASAADVAGSVQTTFYNVTLNKTDASSASVESTTFPWAIANNLAISDGTFEVQDLGTPDLDVDGAVTIAAGAVFSLDLAAGITASIGGGYANLGTVQCGTSVITFDGGAVNINAGGTGAAYILYSVIIATSSKSLKGDINLDGSVTISAGATLIGDPLYVVTVAGNWTNDGTYTPGDNLVTFDGAVAAAINGAGTLNFYNFALNKSAAATTVTPSKALDIDGDVTLTVGALVLGAFTHTIAGDYSAPTANGRITSNTSTVTFDGAGSSINTGGTTVGQKNFYNLVINSAGAVTVVTSNMYISGSLTITGGEFNNGAAKTVTILGNFINNGTFTGASGTISFNGSSLQTVSGASQTVFYNLTVVKAGFAVDIRVTTAVNPWRIAGALTLTSGGAGSTLVVPDLAAVDLDVNGAVTINASCTLNLTDGGASNAIAIGGVYTNSGTLLPGTGTITFDGTSGAFPPNIDIATGGNTAGTKSFYNVTIAPTGGATRRFTNNANVDGDLTISSGAMAFNANWTMTVAGNWVNNATHTATTGTISFDGAAAATISGTGTLNFFSFTLSKGAAATTLTPSKQLDVNGTLTLTTGTLVLGTFTHLFAGFYNNSAANGRIDAGTSTVTFDGASNTVWAGGITAEKSFNNVQINTAGTKTVSVSNMRILGDLTVTAGGVTFSAITLYLAGNFENNGTATATTSTVQFDGASATQAEVRGSAAIAFGAVTVNKSDAAGSVANTALYWSIGGQCTISDGTMVVNDFGAMIDLDVNGKVDIISGGILDLSDADVTATFAGDYANAGTFTAGTSSVIFDGNGGTITCGGTGAGFAFYDIAFNSGGTWTLLDDMDVDDDLSILGGTFNGDKYNINVGGDWTCDDTYTHDGGSNTVIFDGANAADLGGSADTDFNNVTVDKSDGTSASVENAGVSWRGGSYDIAQGTLRVNDDPAGSDMSIAAVVIGAAGAMALDAAGDVEASVSGSFENYGDFEANDADFTVGSTFRNDADFDAGSASITVSGDYLNNGTLTAGTSTFIFSGASASIETGGTGAANAFFNFSVSANMGATKSLGADNLEINGDFSCGGSGTFAAGARNIFCAGDWVNTSIFDPGTGEVTLDGSGTQTVQTDGATGPFNVLNINCSGTALIDEDIFVETEIDLTGGILSNPDGIAINCADDVVITVRSGATLSHAGTITTQVAGEAWTMSVLAGGNLSIDAGYVTGGAITVANAPGSVLIDGAKFGQLPPGVGNAYIDLTAVVAGSVELFGITFSSSDYLGAALARNIKADSDTQTTFVTSYAGGLGGETFDNDPDNKIRWINNPTPLQIDDGTTQTYANTLQEALATLDPGTDYTLRASYTNGDGQPVTATATFVGEAIYLDGYTSVLSLDGFTFVQTAAAEIVIGMATTCGVTCCNCMFISEAAGTPRFVDADAAGGDIDARFCTIDTGGNSGGFTSMGDSIEARDEPASHFVNYDSRNLRLTKSGYEGVDAAVAPEAGFERDIDGKLRPNAPVNVGAFYYVDGASAQYLPPALADLSAGGSGLPTSALTVDGIPASNSAGGCIYLSASDGAECFVLAISRTDGSILDSMSWTGTRASRVTFMQTADNTNRYWVYIPYDSDGDSDFDRIRKVLYDKTPATYFIDDAGVTSNIDVGNGTGQLANADSSDPDIMSDGGWDGYVFISLPVITGSPERQVVLTTDAGNGEAHVFYLNPASADGQFYDDSDFTNVGVAAESYISGTYELHPNTAVPCQLFGNSAAGDMTLVRIVQAGSDEVLLRINRQAGLTTVDAGDIATSLDGPVLGGTFSSDPLITQSASNRRIAAYTNAAKIVMFERETLDDGPGALDLNQAGHATPLGQSPKGAPQAGTILLALDGSPDAGLVAAVEYNWSQDGGATYDILDGSYAGLGGKLHYDEGSPGSFDDGFAPFVGKPSASLYSLTNKTFFLATEGGMLYAWRVAGILSTDDASDKGALRTGYPVRVPGGRITSISYFPVTDATILAALGIAAGQVIGMTTDNGEVIFIRQP